MPNLVFGTTGVAKVVGDQEKVTAAQKKTTNAMGETREEAKKLDRIAQDIARRQESAQNKYNRLLRETKEALDSNRIGQEQSAKEIAKINSEMKNSEGRFRSYAKEQKATFGAQAVAAIGKYVVALGSVHTATRIITEEMQTQQRLRDQSQQAVLTASQGRTKLLHNLSLQDDPTIEGIMSRVGQLSAATDIPEQFITAGLAETISASSGNVEGSMKAVELVAKFIPDQQQAIADYAGTLLDLAKVTGTDDPLTNLGLLSVVGEAGRITDPAMQAKHIPKALSVGASAGLSTTRAAALYAALTFGSTDKTGETTGTLFSNAAIGIGKDFTPGSDKMKKLSDDIARTTEKIAADQERLATEQEQKQRLIASLKDDQIDADRRIADATKRLAEANEDAADAKTKKEKESAADKVANATEQMARTTQDEGRRQTANAQRIADADRDIAAVTQEILISRKALAEQQKAQSAAQTLATAFAGLTPDERLAMLQARPDLAREFANQIPLGEGKTKNAFMDFLFNPNSPTALADAQNMVKFGGLTDQGLQAIANRQLGMSDRFNTLEPVAAKARKMTLLQEQLDLAAASSQQLTTQDKATIHQALVQSGQSSTVASMSLWLQAFGGAPGTTVGEAADLLRIRRGALTTAQELGVEESSKGPSRDESIKILDTALEKLNEISRMQLDEQKKTNERLENAGLTGVSG